MLQNIFSRHVEHDFTLFTQGGAKIAASAAITELDELIATVTNYLRSQSLWVRRDGLWDSDEM